jgi:hypothetical protein
MPPIIQGKANIKYLLIVALVAAVAGGIIYSNWNYFQKEINSLNQFIETKKSEKNIIINNNSNNQGNHDQIPANQKAPVGNEKIGHAQGLTTFILEIAEYFGEPSAVIVNS